MFSILPIITFSAFCFSVLVIVTVYRTVCHCFFHFHICVKLALTRVCALASFLCVYVGPCRYADHKSTA
jgi:hypothetical protein